MRALTAAGRVSARQSGEVQEADGLLGYVELVDDAQIGEVAELGC